MGGIKMIKQTVMETKEKEPAPQEAVTSSNNNASINNDNTKSQICQEETIDYKDKYYKCASLLLDINVNIKKADQLLYNLWNDFAMYDIDESQFFGAACLSNMSGTDTNERKAAQRLLSEYDRLFTFINIALDYTYEIKKSLEDIGEL